MKQKLFTFLLIAVTGLAACRKDGVDISIKEYDEQQIQNYISANSITGLTRDTSGGDTTGMYYKIINKGTGVPLEYSDRVSLVFTLRSFDGKFISADTIISHIDDYLGHLQQDNLPKGLQSAIHNVLKYRDGSMRLLIPSRLAYGKNGYGTGSISNPNSRIAGNQSLDYYVHVIDDQQVYDDLVIRNYMALNSLTGYSKTDKGVYYKIITAGEPTNLNELSTITTTYTGSLVNNVAFDESAKTTATTFTVNNLIQGVQDILIAYGKKGSSISMFIPSRWAYGVSPPSGSIIPVHAPLRFEFQISNVTND